MQKTMRSSEANADDTDRQITKIERRLHLRPCKILPLQQEIKDRAHDIVKQLLCSQDALFQQTGQAMAAHLQRTIALIEKISTCLCFLSSPHTHSHVAAGAGGAESRSPRRERHRLPIPRDVQHRGRLGVLRRHGRAQRHRGRLPRRYLGRVAQRRRRWLVSGSWARFIGFGRTRTSKLHCVLCHNVPSKLSCNRHNATSFQLSCLHCKAPKHFPL